MQLITTVINSTENVRGRYEFARSQKGFLIAISQDKRHESIKMCQKFGLYGIILLRFGCAEVNDELYQMVIFLHFDSR